VRWAVVLLITIGIASASTAASAAEQAEEFLRGLRERGLNELALDYLERMETSPLADEQFRRQIPYHRGIVLLDQSRQSVDPALRKRLLDEAGAALQQYASGDVGGVQAAEAQLQLGTMQLERGQQLVAQADKLSQETTYDADRNKLAEEARGHFSTARDTFQTAAAIYDSELAKLPPASGGNAADDEGNQRQDFRFRVAQLRFLAAQANFETANSHAREDQEFQQLHESAAQEFSTLFDEFSRSTVGLYARLYEGRCYHALAQYPKALGCYEDILNQPNVLPPFRKLIASAVHRKAEALLAQNKEGEAVAICRTCLEDASTEEQELPEWLAVRFRLANALEKQASALASDSPERRKLLAEARDAYRLVSVSPNEFQSAARAAAAALGSQIATAATGEPGSFQAAYDLGKDALASYNTAKIALPSAKQNNPAVVAELDAQMKQGKNDARRYFTLATTLIDDDTDLALVNEVRYFLSWLYWEAEDYYRSAVLGEFLARRYPDHPTARSAAKIAMASFERLYRLAADRGSSDSSNTEFEARRMAQVAEFIVRRWPNTEDADAAFGVLVSYALRNNRLDEAEELLANASPQSRPRLELQLGNAMWGRYLELSQASGPASADESELGHIKESAVNYLRTGFEAARSADTISDAAATAGLYLAQAALNDGQYEQAIALLEDPALGPLTLVAQEHVAVSRLPYRIEAYKAALRAYCLVSPPQEEKAIEVIRSLEAVVQSNGDNQGVASDQLMRIYISLGMALQEQARKLRKSGREAEAERVTAAVAQFLQRIGSDPINTNWPTTAWLAQMYFNLGVGEQGNRDQIGSLPAESSPATNPPPEMFFKPATGAARDHFTKARDAYQQMLKKAAQDPKFAPNANAILAAQVQLGQCYRALGEYEAALKAFSSVLKEKESSLTVQQAAAYTYQARGQVEDPQWLERAIHGGHRLRSTGKNRIWGWLKISQVAARAARNDQELRDTFFEARLNVARCRYLAATKTKGAARQQNLAKAKQSVQSMQQLYPQLGGERWRGQFEELIKQIQEAADNNAVGLKDQAARAGRDS
jgi:hypothetical protein